jgi:hypothetical protein
VKINRRATRSIKIPLDHFRRKKRIAHSSLRPPRISSFMNAGALNEGNRKHSQAIRHFKSPRAEAQ